jgi:spermidine synthase
LLGDLGGRTAASMDTRAGEPGSIKRVKGFWFLMAIFFLSGLCGIVYEVVWSRLLILVFGNTTYAISTVVAVFMFGLALGSYAGGRWLLKIKNLLKGYAFLEMGIGLYAALFLPILAGVQQIHSALFPSLYAQPAILNLVRILLSLGLLLIPTALMGATFPLLGQLLIRYPPLVGRETGILYALNTFGAAVGCFLGAFLFIPSLGIPHTLFWGAICNGAIGAITWCLSRNTDLASGTESKPRVAPLKSGEETKRKTDRPVRIILFSFLASGYLALVYEVAWSRALILIFGSSIYAFATILTTYLLGMALGSFLLGRLMDRIQKPIFWFFGLQGVIGATVFITTPLIGRLPDYFLTFFAQADISWGTIALKEFGICFLIILTATFASGASFPLVTRIFIQHHGFNVGRAIADAYSFNTVGGIMGSLTAGFILIPLLGVEKTLLLGGGLNLLIASLGGAFAPGWGRSFKMAWGVGCGAAAVVGFWALPSWNPKSINAGVYLYGKTLAASPRAGDVDSLMSPYQLLFYREGTSATVTVFQKEQQRFLRVNGKTDGSNASDNYTQVLLGLLPIMYSPHPETALVIGLGTGITLGSILEYPVRQVDCIEISPEVIEAASFFKEENGDALRSPRVQLHALDGRTWLMAMPREYDLISSEPSHPWQTGNANLFTVDFFELAKRRLKRGGVFCQWLPIYHMDQEHFRLLVGSFTRVFPYVHIWMATTDALLIGSTSPTLSIDYGELQKRMEMPSIKQRLNKLGIHNPEDFLSFFYLDQKAVAKFVSGVEGINSDYNPVLEFSAPKYLFERVKPDTFLAFLNLSYGSPLPFKDGQIGEGQLKNIQSQRMNRRAEYFREWRIPETVIRQMLKESHASFRP